MTPSLSRVGVKTAIYVGSGEHGYCGTCAGGRKRHDGAARDGEREGKTEVPAPYDLLRGRVEEIVAVVQSDLRAKARANLRCRRDGTSRDLPSSPTADRARTAGQCENANEPDGRTTFAQKRNEASRFSCPKFAGSVLL